MSYSSPTQLCFPPVGGQTVRADFEGGALSSDFGALLLRGVDRQIGLTARLTAAIHDKRHRSSIDHPLRDLLAQRNHCYLPRFIFEGTSQALVTASLRPGTCPTGAENAMILVRLLSYLRHHWPHTHTLVRGDSHFATPEVIDVITSYRWTDFVFGLAGNAVLLRQAASVLHAARRLHQQRVALAQAHGGPQPASSRLYDEFSYAAQSWAHPWRVVLKAEVMSAGDNPRFVVTSLAAPAPQMVYEDLSCARGNCENAIKAVKNALHSDRTSATSFLANAMRLLLACAAYVLHHALRTHTLQHTALAQAPPSTIILTLFKIATQIKQYKDRILLHLPSACPVKALLHRVTALLAVVPLPVGNTS